MHIKLRDSAGNQIGTIEIDAGNGEIIEEKCEGLHVTDIDSTEDGRISYRMDFLENRILQNASTEEILSEIERRIDRS